MQDNNDFGRVLQETRQDTNSGLVRPRPVGSSLKPGEVVGRYQVIRCIGVGGAGEVYAARDQVLGREIALKVLRDEATDIDSVRKRFVFELQVTARFNHPNIVTIHDVGETDGRPWAALELLEGRTLNAEIQRGVLPPRRAMEVAREIADALVHAHAAGVVHRDLKPDNVFLVDDNSVRVLDFGIAKARFADGAENEVKTAAGQLVGTPAYMAPEQWLGKPPVPATDIFQLGLLLFRSITGRRAQNARGASELASAVLDSAPLARLPARAGLPSALADLVAACLRKRADRRPDAQTVVATLTRLIGEVAAEEVTAPQVVLSMTKLRSLAHTEAAAEELTVRVASEGMASARVTIRPSRAVRAVRAVAGA